MDSRLLNAFHDDSYDNCTSIWSDTLGLQLTETLDGILPSTPTEDDLAKTFYKLPEEEEYYCDDIIDIEVTGGKGMSPSIEIISVDPFCEFSSPLSMSIDDDGSDEPDIKRIDWNLYDSDDECIRSNPSNIEYDSSSSSEDDEVNVDELVSIEEECSNDSNQYELVSIKDECSNDFKNVYIDIPTITIANKKSYTYEMESTPILQVDKKPADVTPSNLIQEHNFLYDSKIELLNTSFSLDDITSEFKMDTILQDKKCNDEDLLLLKPLEADVDVGNFDLATFITQDDYIDLPQNAIKTPISHGKNLSLNKLENILLGMKEYHEEYDSDESIDIETVHENPSLPKSRSSVVKTYDLNESFSQIDDDPVRDPSWTPSVKNIASKPQKSLTKQKNIRSTIGKSFYKCPTKVLPGNNRLQKITPSRAIQKPDQPIYKTLDRKNIGLGRGKNISMCSKPDLSDPETVDSRRNIKTHEQGGKNIENYKICKIQQNSAIYDNRIRIPHKDMETIVSKPQESLLKKKLPEILIAKKENSQTKEIKQLPKVIETNSVLLQEKKENSSQLNMHGSTINKLDADCIIITENKIEENSVPIKKKLNLEEYKQRRGGTLPINKLANNQNNKTNMKSVTIPNHTSMVEQKPFVRRKEMQKPQENLINNVNKKLETSTVGKSLLLSGTYRNNKHLDPITEAKNKVLRLQELKKVARTKLIDSTVSAKVGPITKILPLEEITAMTSKSEQALITEKDNAKINLEYEEIIIVSTSCNTDISISPILRDTGNPVSTSASKNSLRMSKSSSLLFNISNTIEKAKSCGEPVKISSSSLISSIQDVVLKKVKPTALIAITPSSSAHSSPNIGVSPPSQFSPGKPEMSQTDYSAGFVENTIESVVEANNIIEHGEDKIIMHLRKDRIRNKMNSSAVQTELSAQFPPLTLLLPMVHSNNSQQNTKLENNNNNKCSNGRAKRNYRQHRSSSYSSDDEDRTDLRSSSSYVHSTSSHHSNRSNSPRYNRLSSEKRKRNYSSSRRTVSPHRRKKQRRCSRSSSRNKYIRNELSRSKSRSTSTTKSGASRRGRSRDRRRRRRRYSSSESCSSSSSKSRSYSRSRSRTRSRSRHHSGRRSHSRTRERRSSHFSPAVEERRIVYVGRIEREISKEDLKRKFSTYGPIRQITLHYKDTGMKYGFVTFERAQDAYKAIDNGQSDPKINMYDISFGGRRAFCRSVYSDLDGAATNTLQAHKYPAHASSSSVRNAHNSNQNDLSFEALLQKVKDKMSATKSANNPRNNKT